MNLLYLTIGVPLLSFILLVCLRRNIRIENTIVIGIGTISILCLLMIFVCIDYHVNMVPDTSLIYTRYLWEWIKIGTINIPISLYLDGLSLVFLLIILFFGLISYFFAAKYFSSSDDIYHFFAYGNLLIASLFLLILADNLFVFLIGWEGVGISCYLLIGIYYKNVKASSSTVKWFVITHITDAFLLFGIFLIFNNLNTFNIRELLSLANDNLAVDSEIVFLITTLLLIGIMGRLGQFPFHLGFVETAIAPMPVVALVQSFTIVLSGGYLVLRLSPLFIMSNDIFMIMGAIAAINIIFTNCISLVQNDIKRIVTYINSGQISYLFFAFATQNWVLSINYLICYCVTSLLLLLTSSILIKIGNGERNIYKLGMTSRSYPLLYGCFLLSVASLGALPWIMSSFYTKGDIIWGLMLNNKIRLGTIALIGILLSNLNVLRLFFTVFHHKKKLTTHTSVSRLIYIPLIILAIISTAILIYLPLPLPIEGIINISSIDNENPLSLQLLLIAITILGILVSYILFFRPNSEVREIVKTPISKSLIRLWSNQWYFDKLIQLLFICPYIYMANLIKKDPLSKWTYIINWGIRRINLQIVSLENGRLRWYIMSVVIGSIIMLLFLVLV